ncbi:MAG: esterase [Pseudonocardiales bacterium]|nr:esterase [Pseudonocardiales bacterium]
MKVRLLAIAFAIVPIVVIGRALRVRLSVGPRRRYWRTHDVVRGDDYVVVALGDSLTQGVGSSRPSTSWIGLFVTYLETSKKRPVRLSNRAIYGAKVADVITRQLPLPTGTDLVTLCIGANDAGRTSPEAFRGQLRQVCGQLPAGSIVGDLPEFQWGSRVQAAAELSLVVREVVAAYPHLRLAEVEKYTIGTKILTELAGDFFHPGNRGYRRISDAFVSARGPVA